MTPKRLKEIKARCEAATGDEWGWFNMGNGPILATRRHGRLIVMDFVRKGMQSAQPRFAKRDRYTGGIMFGAEDYMDLDEHPDASFIAHARQDLPDCLDEIERLQTALRNLYNDCRNEPCDEQRGRAMEGARKALESNQGTKPIT